MRLSVTLAALVLALAACGEKDVPAGSGPGPRTGSGAPASAIRIGVAGPITGGQAKNGEDLVDGTTMAVEEWNAKGGVLGRQIEIVVRDDMADAKLAPVVAGQLIDQKVSAVIGHFNSGSTLPASPKYNEAGIVMITPASTAVEVTDRKLPLVFRMCGRDDIQGACAAKFVSEELKAKRVAVYDDKTAYGVGLADGFARSLAGKCEIVIREGFSKDERNFRLHLSKLKDAKVDLWYFGGIYEQAAPLLTQARALGIGAPMMSGDGVHGYVDDFVKKVGPGANGTYTTFANTEAVAGYKAFVDRYRARFQGKEPGPYAIYSYSSASIVLRAMADAGASDGAAVAAAMRKGTYETPLGPIAFDEKGDVKGGASNDYVVWTVRDGAFARVGGK